MIEVSRHGEGWDVTVVVVIVVMARMRGGGGGGGAGGQVGPPTVKGERS